MDQNLKREIILEHNSNPCNFNKASDDSYNDISAINPSCIDKFSLKIKLERDVIKDLIFIGEGCAIATSTTSIMTTLLINNSIKDALNIIDNYLSMINEKVYDESLLGEALVFDQIYKQANRKKCASLTWETVRDYLANYQN